MKKWEKPQVRIDQFAANECVSACKKTDPMTVSDSYYYYVDYNKDGYFAGINTEDASPMNVTDGKTHILDRATGVTKRGWLNDVNIYGRPFMNGYNGGQQFSSSDLVGTYDIYIVGNYVFLFKQDTYDGETTPPFTPTPAKNYS